MARGLSLVAGGGFTAPSGPAVERPILKDLGERWSLPRPIRPTLSELFASHPRDGGWAGFLLAQVETGKPLLWVQERMAILEAGRLYPPGLACRDLIHVTARDARSALWAMEEGLRCAALGAVIGELWGDPASLDFTATRRLAVASERSGVPAWLVRLGGAEFERGANALADRQPAVAWPPVRPARAGSAGLERRAVSSAWDGSRALGSHP